MLNKKCVRKDKMIDKDGIVKLLEMLKRIV